MVIRQPIFHTVTKNVGFPYQFAKNPHLLIRGRYSGSTDIKHELVFRHVFRADQAATIKLLQSCRTAAHTTIRERLGINPLYTDAIRGSVIVVKRKTEKQQGEWTLIGDLRVRFPSARAASTINEQQRTQHLNKDTQSSRMLSQREQVCPTFIPTGHTAETSHDDNLHKAYISCTMFRGRDSATLQQLFIDNLQEIYDRLFHIDVDALAIPDDFYTSIAEATESTGESHIIELEP